MKSKYLILVFLLLAALVLGCAQEKMNAKTIADKMLKKSKEIEDYKTDIFYQIKLGPKVENVTMFYMYKKPNKVYIYNKKLDELTVSNGKTMWIYDKKNNIVYVMDVSKLSEKKKKNLESMYSTMIVNFLENYNLTFLNTTTINGRKCYVVKLIPKNKMKIPVKMEMWIDAEYWLPVKVYSAANSIFGNVSTTIEYRNLSVNTGISDNVFNFIPPKGAKVIYGNITKNLGSSVKMEVYNSFRDAQKHVNFTLIVPSYTANLKLKKLTVINSTHQAVIAEYSNSNSTCKMIISESLGKLTPSQYTINTTINGKKVLEWKKVYGDHRYEFVKNGVRVSVFSNCLSNTELKKVVESMLS